MSEQNKILDNDAHLNERLEHLGISYFDSIWVIKSAGVEKVDKPIIFNWSDRSSIKLNTHYRELLKRFTFGMLLGVTGRYAPITIKLKVTFLKNFFAQLQREKFENISLIDTKSIVRMFAVKARKGNGVKRQTLDFWVTTVNHLYRMKQYSKECFSGPQISKRDVDRISSSLQDNGYWEAPPETTCIYLLRVSIDFLERHSQRIISVYDKYVLAVETALELNFTGKRKVSNYVKSRISLEDYKNVLDAIEFCQGWKPDALSIATLVKHLFSACLVVITFTCGPRISEIRRAGVSSVQPRRHDSGEEYFYYHAPRSKRRFSSVSKSSGGMGQEYPWVVSPAALKAFEVLVELSKHCRNKSGIDNLWLSTCGNALWPFNPRQGYAVATDSTMNSRLHKFSKFVRLQAMTGWEGRIHSHIGRKHFARFIAKRDRSALGELARQYSHVSADSIDISYARPDSEFRRMVEDELSAELNEIGVQLLSVPKDRIYTAPTTDRVTKFLGELRKARDINLLVTSGIQMFPCQWGLCLYTQKTSLCQGDQRKPNVMKRTPSVCSDCSNFMSTPKHLQWWQEFELDCVRILKQKKVPAQTQALIDQRLKTARSVIAGIKEEAVSERH